MFRDNIFMLRDHILIFRDHISMFGDHILMFGVHIFTLIETQFNFINSEISVSSKIGLYFPNYLIYKSSFTIFIENCIIKTTILIHYSLPNLPH